MTYPEKLDLITALLMRYCDPRPEYVGMNAKTIAGRIIGGLEGHNGKDFPNNKCDCFDCSNLPF